MADLNDIKFLTLPKILDNRGNLSFVEGSNHIPFKIERTYCIYDVPGGEERGGHAYLALQEVIIALSGSFDVVLSDGKSEIVHSLNRSYNGIYVPNLIWRGLRNFSTNSVALIIASRKYEEHDYIRDFSYFKQLTDGN